MDEAAMGAQRGVAARSLRELVASVTATNRLLTDLRQRRAAERAAAAAGTVAGCMYEADSDCPVCFEQLDRPHVVTTACGHVFHATCVAQAMEAPGSKCPICRRHIHAAELVQLMNGLPTKRTFEYVVPDGQHIPVDLTDIDDGTQVGFEGECTVEGGTSKISSRKMSPADIGKALDDEIRLTLKQGQKIISESDRLRSLEVSLENDLDIARRTAAEVQEKMDKKQYKLLAEVSAKNIAVKVREQKLENERKDLVEARTLLHDQVAVARKRADQLSVVIKTTQAAQAKAQEEEAAAEAAKDSCEKRRQRFQELAESYEKKHKSLKADRPRIEELEKENQRLKSIVEGLRKQIRRSKGMPPPSPLRSHANPQFGKRAPRPASLVDMDMVNHLAPPGPADVSLLPTVESYKGGMNKAAWSDSDGAAVSNRDDADDIYDDDDDDVVAAANLRYVGDEVPSAPSGRQERSLVPFATPILLSDGADSRALHVASSIFGPMSGPRGGLNGNNSVRPPPPRNVYRNPHRIGRGLRGGRGGIRATGPGLGVFATKSAHEVQKVGAIAALRPIANQEQQVHRIGSKRASAPSTVGMQSQPKKRLGKISTFFS
jgi:hypothetical protein